MNQYALDFDSPEVGESPYARKVAEFREISYGFKKNAPAAVSYKATAWMALCCMDVPEVPAAIMAERFGDALMRVRASRGGRDHTEGADMFDQKLGRYMGYLITPNADPVETAHAAFNWVTEERSRAGSAV